MSRLLVWVCFSLIAVNEQHRRRSCAGIRFNTQLALQFNPLSNSHVLAVTSPTTFLKLMPIYVAPIRDFFNPQWLSPLELATVYNLVF